MRSWVEVSFDSLLGGSQPKHKNPNWTRDAAYQRRGLSVFFNFFLFMYFFALVLFDWDSIILINDLNLFTRCCCSGFCPSRMCWGIWFLVAGSVYNLSNFFGSRNKDQYRVADHVATVSFSWNSSLSVLENPSVLIPEDRFRFHSYEDLRPTVTPRVIFILW